MTAGFPHGGLAADIEEAIGPELTRRLLAARGGTDVHIPVRAEGSLIAGIIGVEGAEALLDAFGAGRLRLPMGGARGIAGRRERAMAMLAGGATNRETAIACDLHIHTVETYRARLRDDAASAQLTLPFDTDAPGDAD